ncbi:efflux transporter outer membrane subunit [Siccirubricoccus phaeus]|uniref:efflux transporter outer membrane subunit n=1 Tax=Siccirubricoccus phaeus TaxID=2595053 RepID=UPI0011F0C4CB|nr:efflux transporter outer membrane subunit [Siccirubricoccus phaeus]
MAILRGAALLLALPLLGGCDWLTPGPTTSGLDLPARLSDAAGDAAWPDPAWWRGFGATELDGLMAEAMQANNDMAAAAARIRQADAQLRIAGAALLPTVDFAGQASRSQSGSVNTASVTGARTARVRVTSSDRIALSASYEVDFWGKNRAATEAAEQAAQSARFAWATVMLTTQASVANTYFALLAYTEQLKLQQQNLEIAERVRQVIADRLSVGTAGGLDLAQQETVVAQQKAAIPPLAQQVAQNRNALATLIGRAPEGITLAADVFTRIAVPRVQPGLPTEVLARRPDVLSAESDLAAAQANVVAARAALLPSVTLTGSGGYTSLALETLLRPTSIIFTLTAGIAQPIFEGGRLRGQVQYNEARAAELLATYRGAILAALVDTENALVGLRQSTEQETLQAEAVRMAERAYAISEAQLRAGTIDLVTLLNTQQTLFSARNTLTAARLARLQAAVGLFRALGGGWGTL